MYALFTNNVVPLLTMCAIGECLAIIYLAVYIAFTNKRRYTLQVVGSAFAFIVLLSTYAFLGWQGMFGQSVNAVGNTIGYIGIVVVVVLYGSPFETVRQVIRTKSVCSLPILMIIAGTLNNGLWTAYSLLDNELLIGITNSVCVVFGVAQIVIYILYCPRRTKLDLPKSIEILTPTFDEI